MLYKEFLKQSRTANSCESAVDCLNDFSDLDRDERQLFIDNHMSRITRLLELANQDDEIHYHLDLDDYEFYTDTCVD